MQEEHAQKPDPVLDSFHHELKQLVEAPLTVKSLHQITEIANLAQSLLAVRNPRFNQRLGKRKRQGYSMGAFPNPSPYMEECDDEEPGQNYLSSSSMYDRETFGAKVLRELVAVIPEVARSIREDPAQVVKAIAAARQAGLGELAESLEARLLGTPEVPQVENVKQLGAQR